MKILHATSAAFVLICGSFPALSQGLTGSEWVPVEVDGAPFEPSPETHLGFQQDGSVYGNAGCNSIRGNYVTNQDAILFGPMATTMMMCPGIVSQQEMTFNRAVGRARFFEQGDDSLILKDGGGIVVMQMVPRAAE